MSFSNKVKEELKNSDIDNHLKSAFLKYGTISDPQKSYHLEMSLGQEQEAQKILNLIQKIKSNVKIEPKIFKRNGLFVVYIKACDSIVDFLTFIGAPKCAMEVMQIKMFKDARNYANRMTNFETANLDRTIRASSEQIKLIKDADIRIGIDNLPPDIKKIARIRLMNPHMSLSDIGNFFNPPISRSAVNTKFKKLKRILLTKKNK